MNNPATVTHLTGRGLQLGDGDGAVPVEQAWVRLDQVWRALVLEVPSLVGRIQAEEVDPEAAADVVADATMRVLRNPTGVESRSGAIDDWSETEKLADATQDVYFTAAELRRLQVASGPSVDAWSGSLKYIG